MAINNIDVGIIYYYKEILLKREKRVDKKLLSLLVCPVTKSPLHYDKDKQELISVSSGLAYPVKDGIPVMLEAEAREMDAEEKEQWVNK